MPHRKRVRKMEDIVESNIKPTLYDVLPYVRRRKIVTVQTMWDLYDSVVAEWAYRQACKYNRD